MFSLTLDQLAARVARLEQTINMKTKMIYVAMDTRNYEHDLAGVFSTKENAMKLVEALGRNAYLKELELDEPSSGVIC